MSPGPSRRTTTADDERRRRLRAAVVLTFPLAFVLHDLEEVLAAGTWGRRAPDLVRERVPRAPDRVARAAAVSTGQMAVAITVVGAGVAVVTRSGWRHRDDDLGLLPPALGAFAAHGVTHLLGSAVLRAYTPGVLTVPLVVAPWSAWAGWALHRAGGGRLPTAGELLGAAAATAVLVGGGQLAGAAVVRGRAAPPDA
ncbi:HXXEE domain-containing protein [Modestobacter sp. SSW1-42]|uniref:HXXEE domain-containing protein n=1 Tax=Modestobacter sp. SSW1-42 TaxID=596372 RepID=UPI00398577E4